MTDDNDDSGNSQKTDRPWLWQPGQSGNPSGRPNLDPELRKLRELTKEQFKELATLLLSGTQEDLAELLAKPDTSMLTTWMIRVILTGAENGDYAKLDSLMNRLVGKVKDEMELTLPKPTIIEYEGSRLVLTSKMEKEE